MPLTFNQVIKRLETLALNHGQVNDFRFGNVVEALSRKDVTYPLVLVDMNSGSISKAERMTGWDFEVWFCDLADVVKDARDNEVELFSDLTSIAEDYKAMLEDPLFTSGPARDDNWDINDPTPLQYFKEQFDDVVVAVKMNVRIDVRYFSNRCVIPIRVQNILTEGGDPITTESNQNLTTENI